MKDKITLQKIRRSDIEALNCYLEMAAAWKSAIGDAEYQTHLYMMTGAILCKLKASLQKKLDDKRLSKFTTTFDLEQVAALLLFQAFEPLPNHPLYSVCVKDVIAKLKKAIA